MELTTTAQVRDAIRAISRDEWDALAADCGVPRSTLEKIAYGVTGNPGFDSMVGIVAALKRRECRQSGHSRPAAEAAA